jgi:tocopherol O-methyltransferase
MDHVKIEEVALHYDELDEFYREIWGEHVHHGLWLKGNEAPEAAVEQLIAHLAEALDAVRGDRICDVGCGYGAAARWLAARRCAHVVGVTISRNQYDYALRFPAVRPQPQYLLRDWLENELPGSWFDCVVAIESSEHMTDLPAFYREAARVLKPGGRLGVYAWLTGNISRRWQQRHLIDAIRREGRLNSMATAEQHLACMAEAGLESRQYEDLSGKVSRTWTLCTRRLIRKLLTQPKYLKFLSNRQKTNRIFLFTMWRIIIAYRTGCMRYGLFTASKQPVSTSQ